ncbi:MAG: hypothetical protein HYW90_03325 [Candidatus Sungbacteria bacterium]|nr:hypothetical protein [Candidatus Sungbacteria bacterium]
MENLQDAPIAYGVKRAKTAIKKRMFSYIAAGFGLVAGLAWNDAIKLLIDYFIPTIGSGIIAKLAYAFIITIIVALMLYSIERSLEKEEA